MNKNKNYSIREGRLKGDHSPILHVEAKLVDFLPAWPISGFVGTVSSLLILPFCTRRIVALKGNLNTAATSQYNLAGVPCRYEESVVLIIKEHKGTLRKSK